MKTILLIICMLTVIPGCSGFKYDYSEMLLTSKARTIAHNDILKCKQGNYNFSDLKNQVLTLKYYTQYSGGSETYKISSLIFDEIQELESRAYSENMSTRYCERKLQNIEKALESFQSALSHKEK